MCIISAVNLTKLAREPILRIRIRDLTFKFEPSFKEQRFAVSRKMSNKSCLAWKICVVQVTAFLSPKVHKYSPYGLYYAKYYIGRGPTGVNEAVNGVQGSSLAGPTLTGGAWERVGVYSDMSTCVVGNLLSMREADCEV